MLDAKTHLKATQIKDLVARGLEFVSKSNIDTKALRQALLDLDGPFLLVVAGEFNSGKSSLLNAILGGEFLKEGVTPTTDKVHLISYGETQELTQISNELSEIKIPSKMLRDVRLVDTPGTNAIVEHHQILTEKFLPRADLILFVTSSDRPFTQSEADFISFIRQWGKKLVLIINKIDLLTPEEQTQVYDFVRENAEKIVGPGVVIFPLSARTARRGDLEGSGVSKLQNHIQHVLAHDAAKIKLGTPLGVLAKLLDEAGPDISARLSAVESQLATCSELDSLAERHAERTRSDFAGQIALVMQKLEAIQSRGDVWLDSKVKFSNIIALLNSGKLKESFLDDVVKGSNEDIEKGLLSSMAWLAKRDRELLEDGIHLLKETPNLRPTQSHTLEQDLEGGLENALKEFKPETEAQFLKDHIQTALQHTALWEVGAVGLGALLTLAVSRLVDVLGVFTGLVGVVFGLTILPKRKDQAKQKLRERLTVVRSNIEQALKETLEVELSRNKDRFQSLYRTPALRLEGEKQTLTDLQNHFSLLKNEVELNIRELQ